MVWLPVTLFKLLFLNFAGTTHQHNDESNETATVKRVVQLQTHSLSLLHSQGATGSSSAHRPRLFFWSIFPTLFELRPDQERNTRTTMPRLSRSWAQIRTKSLNIVVNNFTMLSVRKLKKR